MFLFTRTHYRIFSWFFNIFRYVVLSCTHGQLSHGATSSNTSLTKQILNSFSVKASWQLMNNSSNRIRLIFQWTMRNTTEMSFTLLGQLILLFLLSLNNNFVMNSTHQCQLPSFNTQIQANIDKQRRNLLSDARANSFVYKVSLFFQK